MGKDLKSKNARISGIVALITGVWMVAAGCTSGEDPACKTSPCEPETVASTFELAEGFDLELFAAEPLIRDPVGMDVDERGRIFVVEDPGYPEELGGKGAVRLLEDTDGDGRPDRSTTFADGLQAPRGVMAWKGGILVTDAPDIIFFKDTTGNGQADVKKVIMSGFSHGNPQLGINTPVYGLDNWIYAAHRQGGSRPHFPETEEEGPVAGSGNIRFRPDSLVWESTAASSQFGHSFDAFGRHLLTLHNNHISQEILSYRYLARNPDLVVPAASASISDHGTAAEVYPITIQTRHELFTDEGVFTAASGITCYLGGLFPEAFDGASFVAEPAHNLVHVDRLDRNGVALTASRIFEGREFLASTDRWFRPVQFYVGPDGALYVIDYYREVIEQPRFLSEEVLESGILYDGSDRGRIYQIVPTGTNREKWMNRIDLETASSRELVGHLRSDNIWWRRTAQRLLVERRDEKVAGALRELITSADAPETRLHALWTLEGLGLMDDTVIETVLRDLSPGIREHGIRLAEAFLGRFPKLVPRLMELKNDSDPGVKFQLLNTLGGIPGNGEARNVHHQMLVNHIDDEWMQLAALTAPDLDYTKLFEEALERLGDEMTGPGKTYFERLGMLIGGRQKPEGVDFLIQAIRRGETDSEAAWWQSASLAGLAEGLRRSETSGETLGMIRKPVADLSLHPFSASLRDAARNVLSITGAPAPEDTSGKNIFDRAVSIVRDRNADVSLRTDAIKLLQLTETETYYDLLEDLLSPHYPGPIQAAAAGAMSRIAGREVGELILSRWNRMTPPVRTAALEAMLADDERIRLLLDAIEEGEVRRSSVTLQQSRRLMLHPGEEIRLQAQKLLGLSDEPRSEIVERYLEAARGEGDPGRGEAVFERVCSACHQIGEDQGTHYGPDLISSRNKDAENLIRNILMPNTEITVGYEQWRIEHSDGTTSYGVISTETPGSITLRTITGKETTIRRNDIVTMQATDVSAMPEGLEQEITVKEMADLIAFIKHVEN